MARVNRCIELLEAGQPIYMDGVADLSYAGGREQAATWADYLTVEFEHFPLNTTALTDFMRGLRDAGPTRSGHATPTVICTLPANGMTETEVRANAWQIRHILGAGVHGLLLCHARVPEAVRAFVESCRYPFQTIGTGCDLDEGQRGVGGQGAAAEIWALPADEYLRVADPWPMNPVGELLLGLKIEDRHALDCARITTMVPGIGFAEWGPGDMGMSLGYPSNHDPPYPSPMVTACDEVRAACARAGIAFLSSWADPSLTAEQQTEHALDVLGATIIGGGRQHAEFGRAHTGRKMKV